VVFQDRELFPWLNVHQNIGFGLDLKARTNLFPWLNVIQNIEFGLGLEDKINRKKINSLISDVNLKGSENAYPEELSIGMQQRVNLARALAVNPNILLMDEPFTGVDYFTRIRLQELVIKLWEKTKKTIVFVTHDVDEAIFISQRLIVLSNSPSSVVDEIEIDLPRPRTTKTLTSEKFIKIKKQVLKIMGNEFR